MFDEKNKNEVPAEELERIFSCVGLSPPTDDVQDLVAQIDPNKTGKLEFNEYISQVVPYIREGYEK